MKKFLILTAVSAIGLIGAAAALAGNYCPPKLPTPIDFPVSCNDQADPAVAYGLNRADLKFENNGPIFTSNPWAAQELTFKQLANSNSIYVAGYKGPYTPDLTGWLRLASCYAAYIAPEARVAVCTNTPMERADGTVGRFFDILQKQAVASDGPFSVIAGNATYAFWSDGHGLTCDNPAVVYGQKSTGVLVDGDGQYNADSDDAPGQEVWIANRYLRYA